MYKVTYHYLVPIGPFKALDKQESFTALSYWEPEGTSLIYFKTDRFNVRTVGESEIISIEEIKR